MRWDNLRIDAEQEARLPRFKEPAIVRTFDAPEALGTRFYEVMARSGINAVPKRSRMPFRHTINPYRGCAHACSYCVHGDTPVLLASGRTKQMRDIEAGDLVYGTVKDGSYRRYAITRVLDHWETLKKPYRVTLEDGTELVASGDHRFLTNRGWKHVAGTERGRWRRPHLTLNNKLIGVGGFAEGPKDSADYRQGYLCGLIRGDGTIASYEYQRRGRSMNIHTFRLALSDFEALRRARDYLAAGDVELEEHAFQRVRAGSTLKPMMALRSGARARVDRVRDLVEWPRQPEDDWCKGFLAGIFDAEGSHSGSIRIANTDSEIIDWTTYCLRRFDLPHVVEDRDRSNGLRYVRLRGGLRARLRFLHLVDPAITRKRSLDGLALKSDAPLRVASIKPLTNKTRLYDVTTGTGDFIANGVVSHNCFARPTHTYLDFNAREDFEREIVVKVNVPELVRAELGRPSWGGDHVALGTNTDPYQWVEGRYRLMEGIWEAMRDHPNPCSVLTKSPLLLRDVELFRQLREVTEFSTALSIPTIDERAWRETEPHTPHPRKRLEAIGELTRNGIPCSVLVAPLIPGVNDDPRQVEEILEIAGENGAANVTGIGLHLRGDVRDIFFDWLRQYRPDLVPRYEELYRRGAYLPSEERKRLGALTRRFRRRTGTPRSSGFGGRGVKRKNAEEPSRRQKPPEAKQPSLF
jgi:DNA repair photolyase